MPAAAGIACAFAAVLLFAVFPLPTKTFATGDGIFFQLCMCLGIWTVGAALYLAQCAASPSGCPAFVPLASLGGAIWCASNLLLVPIVNTVGVGVCMITWGAVEMLTGWATARFGLFGLRAQAVAQPALNYAAVALGVASLCVLSAASPAVAEGGSSGGGSGGSAREGLGGGEEGEAPAAALLLQGEGEGEGEEAQQQQQQQPAPLFPDWEQSGYDFTRLLTSPAQRRAFGIGACLVAGLLSGSTFSPVQYVVDHRAAFGGASSALLDHLYAHFTGILLASAAAFALYCGASGNRPWVSAPLALPAFACGLCWGCAMVAWFFANQDLSIVVAFPIVTLGPGVVSVFIGWRYFGEVKGARNVALLLAALALFAASATLISLSA